MISAYNLERTLSSRVGRGPGEQPVSRLARGALKLETFELGTVRLLASPWLDQVARACEIYGALPNDDLLKGFRRAAGLPTPGRDMGGWCASTSAVIFGQMLSGLTRLGCATGDETLISKAADLLEGYIETIGAGTDMRMRPYDWEKLICGLVDMHVFAGNKHALPLLESSTRAAAAAFDRSRRRADEYDFMGAGPSRTNEWYTLPENLYRAYVASGNELFKEFADVWLYEDYWRQFATTSSPAKVAPLHAYSHVNSFSSAAMAFRVTGERRFLEACINAYDFLQHTQCYATGGYGPDERLMPPDGSLGRSLELCGYHSEIPCGTWAAFKLSLYLMGFTGEARFGDWIETLLYNGIGQALPTEPDGRTYYYGDYRLAGGTKQHYWHQWPCCSGTYLQSVADYYRLVYLRDEGGLYVNLFMPSQAVWSHQGKTVLIRQETSFPEAENTALRIDPPHPMRFPISVRVPGWCPKLSLAVNDTPVPADAQPGQWAVVEREWRPGDTLFVKLPMTLRLSPVDAQHPQRVAVLYGPQVLAQDEACCRRPLALSGEGDLHHRVVREGPGVKFRILNTQPERHTRYLLPLRAFPAHWPHWVYFDVDARPLY
jgi:hypothetical protein